MKNSTHIHYFSSCFRHIISQFNLRDGHRLPLVITNGNLKIAGSVPWPLRYIWQNKVSVSGLDSDVDWRLTRILMVIFFAMEKQFMRSTSHAGGPCKCKAASKLIPYWLLVMNEIRATALPGMRANGDAKVNNEVAAWLEITPPLDLAGFSRALGRREQILRDWIAFLQTYPVVVTPASWKSAFPIDFDQGGPPAMRDILAAQGPLLAAAVAGLPSLGVPMERVGSDLSIEVHPRHVLEIVVIVQSIVMLPVCDNEICDSMNRQEVPLSYGIDGLIESQISVYPIKACSCVPGSSRNHLHGPQNQKTFRKAQSG